MKISSAKLQTKTGDHMHFVKAAALTAPQVETLHTF
jgi:hypothetical protein